MTASKPSSSTQNQAPQPTLFMRRFMRQVFRVLFFVLCRLKVQGLEKLDRVDGAILAVNHLSYLDAPLVFMLVPRDKVSGMATTKYQRHRFFSWIVNTVDGIWLNREELDVDALRAARAYLQGGWMLGIAPEGTRSRTGALIQAKTGVAYLAEKAGVPVIPVAIIGTAEVTRMLRRLRRPIITVEFGPALHLPPVGRRTRDADLERNTDEIMCQLAARLPEELRGVYAQHPRTRELLEELGR